MSAHLSVDPAATKPRARAALLLPVGRALATPRLLAVGLAVALVLLTVVPLLLVLVGSFRPDGLPLTPGWTLAHYVEVWGRADSWWTVVNTLIFAGSSTALAVGIATALSWLLERTDLPGRNWFRAMILMPMATPPLLLVLAPRVGIVTVALPSPPFC